MSITDEAPADRKKPGSPLLTAEQVEAYLRQHPDFLLQHPQLVEVLKAPKTERGSGVVDLQQFMVGGLQKELKALKGTYDEIVGFCRDNISTQSQVHGAVLGLLKTRDLEQLLQVLTVDLVALFNLDVVRIAMETENAAFYDTSYPEAHYSGISFIDYGTADETLGVGQDILLVEDVESHSIPAFDEIFADCTALVKSCAIMRLKLETVQKDVVLALGVRHKSRFHPHQGVDLLAFLARVIEYRLDSALMEIDPEAFS